MGHGSVCKVLPARRCGQTDPRNHITESQLLHFPRLHIDMLPPSWAQCHQLGEKLVPGRAGQPREGCQGAQVALVHLGFLSPPRALATAQAELGALPTPCCDVSWEVAGCLPGRPSLVQQPGSLAGVRARCLYSCVPGWADTVRRVASCPARPVYMGARGPSPRCIPWERGTRLPRDFHPFLSFLAALETQPSPPAHARGWAWLERDAPNWGAVCIH